MSELEKAVNAFHLREAYSAYGGNLKVDKNILYLFGHPVATNLKTHIAVNLQGYEHFAVQLNRLDGILFERYGDDRTLYLNGYPVSDTEEWLIVNRLYGDWYPESDYTYDYDYGEWQAAHPEGEY